MKWKIALTQDQKVVVLYMASNPVNCVNEAFFADAKEALQTVKTDTRYKGKPLILTSASASSFSAGLDLKSISQIRSATEIAKFVQMLEDFLYELATLPVRTVAAINGHSIAGGYFIALACDVRVCLSESKIRLGLTEVRVGVSFPSFTYAISLSKLPPNTVWKLFLGSQLHSPQEALQMGMVDRIVDTKDQLMLIAREEAELISEDSMPAYVLTKKSLLSPWLRFHLAEKDKVNEAWVKCRFEEGPSRSMNQFLEGLVSAKEKAKL